MVTRDDINAQTFRPLYIGTDEHPRTGFRHDIKGRFVVYIGWVMGGDRIESSKSTSYKILYKLSRKIPVAQRRQQFEQQQQKNNVYDLPINELQINNKTRAIT